MRIYVTGGIAVEGSGRSALVTDSRFPSRQARLLFACLVCERHRPLSRDGLAEMLWEDPPLAWDSALKSLVSKLRRLVPVIDIESYDGCYQIRLSPDCWVDWDAAREALDTAEGAVRAGRFREGWGAANVAIVIGRRGLLPGQQTPWVEAKRRALRELHVRALDAYAEICMQASQIELAAQAAEESLTVEPFRESTYRRLMRIHAEHGNRAEAVRVYHRCRERLTGDLGVSPARETEDTYLGILREGQA